MSKFSKLRTEQTSRTWFKLTDDLTYGDITVPKGFDTNYASIEVFHNILLFPIYALFAGYGNHASTLHDYLYSRQILPRKDCDRVFYEALRDEGVAKWRAWLMWAGVRIGGSKAYRGG
ncbi:hypothetical protein PMW_149 [Pseudomonas phage phiPMW]|uniref:DUF1353 domain-containing protein n=1 Tax=Pseudomonas phage phiPMW TaxID=1815582 RepID=A0A1S5R1J9_9CAUD|nr:tail assembly chaperone [Pseudomonas phage phiPMW]ANA49274.1 hypothetical protein PMW_149 [Pseudomonas phage phiPMW]